MANRGEPYRQELLRASFEYAELATKLKRLRELSGLSTRVAARRAQMSQSKLSKLENASRIASTSDVDRLATIYGANRDVRRRLHSAARQIERLRLTPSSVQTNVTIEKALLELEHDSHSLFALQTTAINSLLHTPEYSQTLWNYTMHLTGSRDQHAALRRQRQQHLARKSFDFHCIVPERVLFDQRIPRQCMKDQLEHLRGLMRVSNVEIGVVPSDGSYPMAHDEVEVIGDFAVISESTWAPGALFSERRDLVHDFDRLCAQATSHSIWGSDAYDAVGRAIDQLSVIDLRSSHSVRSPQPRP